MSHIPSLYRIFFLYIDPLICLSGIYLSFLDQSTYIQMGTPRVLSKTRSPNTPIDPLTQYFMMAVGANLLCTFGIEVILLRQVVDAPKGLNVRIWKTVMFCILLSDLALVYTSFNLDHKGLVDVLSWERSDWTNNGILGTAITIRSAFLLGFGRVGKGA